MSDIHVSFYHQSLLLSETLGFKFAVIKLKCSFLTHTIEKQDDIIISLNRLMLKQASYCSGGKHVKDMLDLIWRI